jgi:HD-GYP domain-containing protein (c-di-GMP phosphodiesterase class II)
MSAVDKRIERLQVLLDLSYLINSTLDTRVIRGKATEAAKMLLNSEAASLLLVDHESDELYFEVALGEKGNKVREIRLRKGQGIAGWVAERGEPVIVADVYGDPRFFRDADSKTDFVTRNMICVPLKSRNRILGVLQVMNKIEGCFTDEDLECALIFANQIAVAIENAVLYEELRETFLGTVLSLAESLDIRDRYTGGHTRRVKEYSLAIGQRLGLEPQELETLQLSAILHDIGKIGVRDNILLKNGRLDPEEFESIKRHPQYGAEILGHVKSLRVAIAGVKDHHESYDGSGYPGQLRGDDIPLFARIIKVADTFDAMTSDRAYRKALSFETAFAELRKFSGIHYDPRVVDAFFAAYRTGELTVLEGPPQQSI